MDLVIQNPYHGLDSPILTLTPDFSDLIVQEAYHDLTSPLLFFFHIPAWAGGEDQNYIELVSSHISLDQTRILTIPEAYHVLTSDAPVVSIKHELWTTWPDGTTFPLPYLTANAGVHINSHAIGQTPAVVLTDARMGSRAQGKIPVIKCLGTMSVPTLMAVSGRIPQIKGSARTGIRSGAGIAPVIKITASSAETLCRLNSKIPLPTASIKLTTPGIGALQGALPFPKFTGSVSYHHLATLAAKIPIPRLSATVGVGGIGTLDRNIPELRLTASAYVASMFVSGFIPLPMLNSLGTGGIGGIPGVIYNEDRFTGYVLRHIR